ncbi:MAG: hypothetical protein M9884_16755 [Rhodocyclaceae bacterium]|nr:hypothetical protein [Rhodocyclaceae bacterium]
MNNNTVELKATATAPAAAKLMAFYLSRDRVLSLVSTDRLLPQVLLALQGSDVPMATAILSNAVGAYVLEAIASGGIKTLQQLAIEGELRPGAQFIYNGHFYGKGFGDRNKKPGLTLTERLDEPVERKTLILEFSKNGLVNNTAYSRMSGSTRLFVFGYIADTDADAVRAVPYVIGDLVTSQSPISLPFASSLELQPGDIAQFTGIDLHWMPSKSEFAHLAEVSESKVKGLICDLLGEHEIPSDWGGEESDLFSAQLLVDGTRKTGAFLLKGPAKFHSMTPHDLGKNGDQLYRLFNIPANIYIVQHCHNIGPAVRKTIEAFALHRSFTAPCRYVIMDGLTTARLLRAHGQWPAAKVSKARAKRNVTR